MTAPHDLRSAAAALGGEVAGRQVICPGPGHSRQDRSLAVRFDASAPGGFTVFSFAGDDFALCRDYVRQRLGLPEWRPGDEQDRRIPAAKVKAFDRAAVDAQAEEIRPMTGEELERIARAQELFNEGSDPRGTVAVDYLRSRALDLPDELAASVLRFHARTPWRDETSGTTLRIPTLVAAFRNIDDDTITAVHRIRLDQPQRWPKADRRMLGVVRRAAVKLGPIGDTLHIGEGVETCLAAMQLGFAPAWALGSVGAISFFPVMDGVRRLRILAETGNASREAIQLCGRRWSRAKRRVQIVTPDMGDDLNDQLMQQRR